jgi:hypothetical protein
LPVLPKKEAFQKKVFAGSRTAKLRCACFAFFDVEIDHRSNFRKSTSLEAFFEEVENPADWGKIRWSSNLKPSQSMNCLIVNISKRGLAFITRSQHNLEVGKCLSISFTLDDSAQTQIMKCVVVRGVMRKRISCEFIDEDKDDIRIGFYLL